MSMRISRLVISSRRSTKRAPDCPVLKHFITRCSLLVHVPTMNVRAIKCEYVSEQLRAFEQPPRSLRVD